MTAPVRTAPEQTVTGPEDAPAQTVPLPQSSAGVSGATGVSGAPGVSGVPGVPGEGRVTLAPRLTSAGVARPVRRVVGWVTIAVLGVAVVLYALSPLFQQRDQEKLLHRYQVAVRYSSLQSTGFFGVELPTEPPVTGSTVGIVEVASIRLQQAVTEGVAPGQTERGPGHVPGTAGLGQPGNAAVVGRRTVFGGAFSAIGSLRPGQQIVVTTTEGQSVYVVRQERVTKILPGSAPPASVPTLGIASNNGPKAPVRIGPSVFADDLYGPSSDNRLTLVTAGSVLPWESSRAVVVVALLEGRPLVPTPQQARSAAEEGRSGADGAWAPLVLALMAFGAVAVGSVGLYRRTSTRSAYLVTTAPLIVVTVLLAVAVSRLMPAWV